MSYGFIYLAKGFRMRQKVWSTLKEMNRLDKYFTKNLFFKELFEKIITAMKKSVIFSCQYDLNKFYFSNF